MFDKNYFNNKTILITGNTGFKGVWLSSILLNFGANIIGYSLPVDTEPNLYILTGIARYVTTVFGDIRDFSKLSNVFSDYQPEIVIHLAAQPLVLESYKDPRYTYETNVMGTVNLLECIRHTSSVKNVLNVTTDKVYKNREWCWGYREDEFLDGFDPYSNSKSCSELVTHSYVKSFFINRDIKISTARAGNVIGGGDFSKNRIIPDCFRAVESKTPLKVRNKNSTRPYQHVLEALFAYLMIIEKQSRDLSFQGSYNVGPNDSHCLSNENLVNLFAKHWKGHFNWVDCSDPFMPHEANFLKLDSSLIRSKIGWEPVLDLDSTMLLVCDFLEKYLNKEDLYAEINKEIRFYMEMFFNGKMDK